MKGNLKIYLQSLFTGAPHNSANDALFEELYGNLCDRYDELIGKGLAEDDAYARAIGEVGDIRPLIDWRGSYRAAHEAEAEMPRTERSSADRTPFYHVPQKPNEESKKRHLAPDQLRRAKWIRAWALSIAVMLYILWLVPTVLWEWIAALFIFVAVGTVLLVLAYTRIPDFWDDSRITYDQKTLNTDARAADLLQAFGIACCILCVLPAAILDSEWGAALMFVVVALGVGMILLASGIRPAAPKKLSREAYAAQTEENFVKPAKKRRNRWLLPVILLAVIAVLVCGILLCVRYDWEFGFYSDGDGFGHYTQIGNGEVTEEVSCVSVYWREGSVSIQPYDGERISIAETVADGTVLEAEEQVHWGVHAGMLSIRHNKPEKLRFHFGKRPDKDLTVLIPYALMENLQDLEVQTISAPTAVEGIVLTQEMSLEGVSGDLSVRDCTVNTLELDSVSGVISVARTTVHVATEVDTVSGSVTISESELGEVKADSTSGDLVFSEVLIELLEADTTSGNIWLSPVSERWSLRCDTTSGSVTLELPADVSGFTLYYDTVSGEFDSEFPTEQKGSRREYGTGGHTIEVDTTSGNLTVRQQAEA